jgi:LacI family transcriptional regulator
MKKKRVTMGDIATLVGVSQPTVSAILNGSKAIRLSDATHKKVHAAAHELGYVIKRVTHVRGAHNKIALVINGLTSFDPFINAINSVREAAWLYDHLVVTFNYCHDDEIAHSIQSEVEVGDYKGVIYASSMTREISQQRVLSNLPTVLLNCIPSFETDAPSVIPADMIGAYKATTHLIRQGCRNIAILTGEKWMNASQQRLSGYRQALVDHDISPNENYIKEANWSLKEAYKQTEVLLNLPQRPDAIFCCSDYMSMGCYHAIEKASLTIPNDIKIIGYDNQQISSESFPPLTTVELPYDEMGKQAIERLFALINEQPLLSRRTKVEGNLIIRDST